MYSQNIGTAFDRRPSVTKFMLLHGHLGVVPLAGVYSNGACPFGLVYKYMENFNAARYMKNQPNVEG